MRTTAPSLTVSPSTDSICAVSSLLGCDARALDGEPIPGIGSDPPVASSTPMVSCRRLNPRVFFLTGGVAVAVAPEDEAEAEPFEFLAASSSPCRRFSARLAFARASAEDLPVVTGFM